MTLLKNKILLITGGATGIGKELVKIALQKGAKTVVVWDKNEKNLNEMVSQYSHLTSDLTRIFPIVTDISKLDEIITASKMTKNLAGSIDIVINNAGILIGKLFHEHSHSEIENGMIINANGYMHVTREFLPEMIYRKSGHICNIASAAGMIGNPNMSVYCASKAAVIGWSESLRLEMNQLKTNIKVTTITPNYINTEMINGVKSVVPIIKKEAAAEKIIKAIEKNKIVERLQFIVYTIPFLKGILPVKWFDYCVGQLLGVYESMKQYTGRNNQKTSF